MRTILILVLAMLATLCVLPASSQTVSLTSAEQARLRQLVSTDGDARFMITQTLKRQADDAKSTRPNPIGKIEMEGKLDGDPAKEASKRSLEDMKKIQALAIEYAATQDKGYAKAARDYIVAWTKTNHPTGDPINETFLEPLEFGYDLVRPTMSEDDQESVNHWLRELASKTLSYQDPKPWTNWNSHRIKTAGLAAFILQDQKLIEQVVALYKRQIEHNLRPDGSSIDFEERDAVSYHDYDIWPLLTFAFVARRNGIDLFNYEAPNGASLAKAVEFLRPFAEGRTSHAEFLHTTVQFDKARAAHGEKGHGIGAKYDPKHAIGALEAGAPFDPSLGEVSLRLRNSKSKYPSIQMLLNAVRE
jgi:Alginate lyase